MNYPRRHSYYVNKLINWLEANGYKASKVEFTGSIGGHYTKRDLWGADIIYRDKHTLGFIQLKTSPKRLAEGKRQLKQDDLWPSDIVRCVAYWPPRTKEPIFYEISPGQQVQDLPRARQEVA